jgi:hypothetical protein
MVDEGQRKADNYLRAAAKLDSAPSELSITGEPFEVVGSAEDISLRVARGLYDKVGLNYALDLTTFGPDYLPPEVAELVGENPNSIYVIEEGSMVGMMALFAIYGNPLNSKWARGLVVDYNNDSGNSKVISFTDSISSNRLKSLGLEVIVDEK